jgi:hypothetical protein
VETLGVIVEMEMTTLVTLPDEERNETLGIIMKRSRRLRCCHMGYRAA